MERRTVSLPISCHSFHSGVFLPVTTSKVEFTQTGDVCIMSFQESALKLQHNQFAQGFKNPPQLNHSPLALVNPGPTTIPPLPVPPLIPHHNS